MRLDPAELAQEIVDLGALSERRVFHQRRQHRDRHTIVADQEPRLDQGQEVIDRVRLDLGPRQGLGREPRFEAGDQIAADAFRRRRVVGDEGEKGGVDAGKGVEVAFVFGAIDGQRLVEHPAVAFAGLEIEFLEKPSGKDPEIALVDLFEMKCCVALQRFEDETRAQKRLQPPIVDARVEVGAAVEKLAITRIGLVALAARVDHDLEPLSLVHQALLHVIAMPRVGCCARTRPILSRKDLVENRSGCSPENGCQTASSVT